MGLLEPKGAPEYKNPKDLRWCPGCQSSAAALPEDGFERCERDGTLNEDGQWFTLTIMCGECNTWRIVIAHEDACDAWERDILDPGMQDIAETAQAIDFVVFADWAATFIGCLNNDIILPEDFA
jgi:hypothetical protein